MPRLRSRWCSLGLWRLQPILQVAASWHPAELWAAMTSLANHLTTECAGSAVPRHGALQVGALTVAPWPASWLASYLCFWRRLGCAHAAHREQPCLCVADLCQLLLTCFSNICLKQSASCVVSVAVCHFVSGRPVVRHGVTLFMPCLFVLEFPDAY